MTDWKNKKSLWAALVTLGVGAVAAGATAIVKIREHRRDNVRRELEEGTPHLTAEQQMVYNEAVSVFKELNERIYNLRRLREELQPLIHWLATDSERPKDISDHADIQQLASDIERFLTSQLPFINACLSTVSDDGTSYVDFVRGAVDGGFDDALDEEPTGIEVENGTKIKFVLRLGYYFPECTIALQPIKSIVLV